MTLDWESLQQRLAHSQFRSKFALSQKDRDYIAAKGMETIERHAADFVATRLAPALPKNDGRQTPWRGHPVFVAQHATGCCCRGCLEKWHHIPKGRPLAPDEQAYVRSVLLAWIRSQLQYAQLAPGSAAFPPPPAAPAPHRA